MRKYFFVIASFLFVLPTNGITQGFRGEKPGGIVTGQIVTANSNQAMEYVNLVLYDENTKTQITGTITDSKGEFVLKGIKPGVYSLKAKFMGYRIKIIEPIELKKGKMFVNIGKVVLQPKLIEMEGVKIVEEKPPIEFKIDKKVVNVSKEYASISGSAVDVLQNVPSVNVDVEGNVSLRGSQSFTVLLNNRPTVLEPNEVLQQIPASIIDKIEIITNDSAKYDPEGISGIINIITKRKELAGTSGIANLNGGLGEKYGGDLLLNMKRQKFNFYLGLDYNKKTFPGTSESLNQTIAADTTSFVKSSGISSWQRKGYGVRGGIDFNIKKSDILSITSRYGAREMERSAEGDFDEWTEPQNVSNSYTSESSLDMARDFYSGNIDFMHSFSEHHELSSAASFGHWEGNQQSTSELIDVNKKVTNGQKTEGEGPGKRLRFKLDYVLPFAEKNKFEAGYQSRFSKNEDFTKVYEYDTIIGDYEFMQDYSHTIERNRDIHSLYTIYSGEKGIWGYQAGLRGEYTYRVIELIGEDKKFTIDRWDGFPTFHSSFTLSKSQQMMASYTRRIRRPRHWYLQPFEIRTDAFNIRKGNPGLKPEYIDSYEVGYQKRAGNNSLSADLYYRVTHNVIERIRSVYDENIMLQTVENVGTNYVMGTEVMLYFSQLGWWNVSLVGNIYDYRIKGTIYGKAFSDEDLNWKIRVNNTFKFGNSTTIQVSGFYNSPRVTSQGERKSFFSTNAALKQYIIGRNLSMTLQVRDVFQTSRYAFTSSGENFSSENHFTHESPVFMLTVSYNFNNYKPGKKKRTEPDEFEEQPMEEF